MEIGLFMQTVFRTSYPIHGIRSRGGRSVHTEGIENIISVVIVSDHVGVCLYIQTVYRILFLLFITLSGGR